MNCKTSYALMAAVLLCACGKPSIPQNSTDASEQAKIYPDYSDITVPANIAPLNFSINEEGDEYLTHVHRKGQNGLVTSGKTTDFDVDKWHRLLNENQGETLEVDVYVKQNGSWRKHPAMSLTVAEEIDPYISYRLIEPSYIGFEEIQICQRNLENFDESEIFNNCIMAEDINGQCINCHSYQDYNRGGNMQMHARINHGGTVIARDGKLQKVNLKTPQTISAGVYPSWHPTLPLIAYSNNITTQSFHELHNNKVEVQDSKSDIILYDIDKNTIQIIANDSSELETFPYWNHDGTALYYASAKVPVLDEERMKMFKAQAYKQIKYNLYRKSFDPETHAFGPTDTIFDAASKGLSATFPRESPDGRWLLFTLAPYGTFHIWHKDADLLLMDLQTGEVRNLREVNSHDVESYHSWSSNGKWIIFSTRRDDGSYTRLYLTHFADGKATKPFIIPQKNPQHNIERFKSYNIPEFMAEPVRYSRQDFIEAFEAEPLQAVVIGDSAHATVKDPILDEEESTTAVPY